MLLLRFLAIVTLRHRASGDGRKLLTANDAAKERLLFELIRQTNIPALNGPQSGENVSVTADFTGHLFFVEEPFRAKTSVFGLHWLTFAADVTLGEEGTTGDRESLMVAVADGNRSHQS
ncbi:MAG: hypothetical protein WBB00_06670 [Mycobacterium sp.]